MKPMQMAPEWTPPVRTASEWQAQAVAHIAETPCKFTPSQDLTLCEWLFKGYGIDHAAAMIEATPMEAKTRFRALRAGMVVMYGRDDVFPIVAQVALIDALRARAAGVQ